MDHEQRVSFDLPEFLTTMRQDLKDDHEKLSQKLDTALDVQAMHDTRIALVEQSQSNVRKIAGAIFGFVFSAEGYRFWRG